MNGMIPDLRGAGYVIDGRTPAQWGFVTYGSDSGHQMAFGQRGARGAPPPAVPAGADDWTLNDEAVRNLGYMQTKERRLGHLRPNGQALAPLPSTPPDVGAPAPWASSAHRA